MSAPESPTLTKRNAIFAVSAATRKSEARAMAAPAPATVPLREATIGRGRARMARMRSQVRVVNSRSDFASRPSSAPMISRTSPPVQNARPVPVSTTTRTSAAAGQRAEGVRELAVDVEGQRVHRLRTVQAERHHRPLRLVTEAARCSSGSVLQGAAEPAEQPAQAREVPRGQRASRASTSRRCRGMARRATRRPCGVSTTRAARRSSGTGRRSTRPRPCRRSTSPVTLPGGDQELAGQLAGRHALAAAMELDEHVELGEGEALRRAPAQLAQHEAMGLEEAHPDRKGELAGVAAGGRARRRGGVESVHRRAVASISTLASSSRSDFTSTSAMAG